MPTPIAGEPHTEPKSSFRSLQILTSTFLFSFSFSSAGDGGIAHHHRFSDFSYGCCLVRRTGRISQNDFGQVQARVADRFVLLELLRARRMVRKPVFKILRRYHLLFNSSIARTISINIVGTPRKIKGITAKESGY